MLELEVNLVGETLGLPQLDLRHPQVPRGKGHPKVVLKPWSAISVEGSLVASPSLYMNLNAWRSGRMKTTNYQKKEEDHFPRNQRLARHCQGKYMKLSLFCYIIKCRYTLMTNFNDFFKIQK